VPVIKTVVPPCPESGETEKIWPTVKYDQALERFTDAPLAHPITMLPADVAVPPLDWAATSTKLSPCAKIVAAIPANVTEIMVELAICNAVPVIMTCVPSCPDVGDRDDMMGMTANVQS